MSQPDRPVWYLARGGLPTPAAEWSRSSPPDWFCHEGDSQWTTFDPSNPPPEFHELADAPARTPKRASSRRR